LTEVRLTFLGGNADRAHSLAGNVNGIGATFLDWGPGDDPDRLQQALAETAPDVAIFFAPDRVPAGLLHGLHTVTVGYVTGLPSEIDAENFDRVVCCNPLLVGAVETIAPVWRSTPLPVADVLFRPVSAAYRRPRVICIGPSAPRRDAFLRAQTSGVQIADRAEDVAVDELVQIADHYGVGVNLHADDRPDCGRHARFHLAAGHLLLSEPLTPSFGLEADIDYLAIDSGEALGQRLMEILESPDLYHSVTVRGRDKAELFRASRVYRRLLDDLFRDIEVFGSPRTAATVL